MDIEEVLREIIPPNKYNKLMADFIIDILIKIEEVIPSASLKEKGLVSYFLLQSMHKGNVISLRKDLNLDVEE